MLTMDGGLRMPAEPTALAGRTVLVTGATGTIGPALLDRLERADAHVVVVAHRAGADIGQGVDVVEADLRDHDGVSSCVAQLEAKGLEPDAIAFLAAAPSGGQLTDFTGDRLHEAMFVKVWAPALVLEHFAPRMAERGWGRAVATSGITGREPVDGYLVGACVNAALRTMVKGMALRWASSGIAINVVAPGPVRSERFEKVQSQPTSQTVRNTFMHGPSGMPDGDYLDATEVAAAIEFLLTRPGTAINGTELLVDGAASLGV